MATDRPGNTPRWRAARPEELAWASYGDEFITYHRPSGTTHLLNAASALLISEILDKPTSLENIADALAVDLSIEQNEHAGGELLATLEFLEDLGLIERVT